MRYLFFGILLLGSTAVAWAEDEVCWYPTQPPGNQFLYRESVASPLRDPTHCAVVPKAATAAQRALTANRGTWKHLKVAGGLATEMTQPEKDAVDAAITQAAAVRAQWGNEVRNNDVCANLLLTGVDAYFDAVKADIDVEVEANAGTVRAADRELAVKLLREIRKLAKYTCGLGKGAR